MEDTEIDVAQLKKQNEEYKNRIKELETQLKKYTNNERHKKYYEKNKERIKQNSKKYMERMKEENPEKLKEWCRTTYLKRKEKNNT